MNERRRKPSGPPPDYQLSAKSKETGRSMKVGAAWIQADGRISIQLDPYVTLSGERSADMLLSLFPTEQNQGGGVLPLSRPADTLFDSGDEPPKAETAADDIPF